MKKIISALGVLIATAGSAVATTYPLTIENCGYKETFTKAPERVVALGQNYRRNIAAVRVRRQSGGQRLLANQSAA